MMKLRVVSKYRNQRVRYAAGQVISVTPDEGAFLMADAPECFEIVSAVDPKPYETKDESRVAGFEMPPVHRQIRKAHKK